MSTYNSGRAAVCSFINAPWMHQSRVGIFILRVGVACMMLCHGCSKLMMLVQGEGSGWMDPLGVGSTLSLALCVFAEFFCSAALLVGFFTRLAALVLAVNFWVAAFVYGEQSSLAQNELPVLYLLCFITLICTGSGPLAVDGLLRRRMRCPKSETTISRSRTGERTDPS